MPKLKMLFQFTYGEQRSDMYHRDIELSDDPDKEATEWVHYIESFLNEVRMAILPVRGRVKMEEGHNAHD